MEVGGGGRPNIPAEGPRPCTPEGHNLDTSTVGEEGHTLFEVNSQEKAKNTSFQEVHEDNKEIASKSADAGLSNDVGKLQRTQLLSPNAEYDPKSKSVLETLPEGEEWTKPPWAQPEGTYFPTDVQRRVHGTMVHFDCESCVSLYLSFNSGTHYKQKS